MGRITRRTQLREAVFLILFRADYYDQKEMIEQIRDFFTDEDEFSDEEIQYISQRVINICEKLELIDSKLDEISIGWKVRRMNRSDLTALRLAYYEIYFDEKVPVAAAINEAVELAKNYGTSTSGAFVNGVLAKAAINSGREIRKNGSEDNKGQDTGDK